MNQLNTGQQLAADEFFNFLFSPDKELNLSGPGGVGKTFLMGYLIDEIMPRYHEVCALTGIVSEYTEVVMTATTNKAAEVLSIATGRPVTTIHSFMNLKVTDDYKTGEQKIEKTRNWKIHQNLILFIDESSMVDKKLLEFIREGTIRCKIIFVGDRDQLASVKEHISPIYVQGLPLLELNEQMRTNVPELQALNDQMRKTVQTGVFEPIKIIPGIIDHYTSEQMEQAIVSQFTNMDHNDRILAYTNDRVVDYNSFIRQVRGMPPHFVNGEVLISGTAIRLRGGMVKVEEELLLKDMNQTTTLIDVADGVQLEVQFASLQTRFGEVHLEVPIPFNYIHYRQLVKYYAKIKDWSTYFYLKNTFPDLRQRDASTVYKAQGSTLDTVYVDLGDISTCHNPNQVARMLYVGLSRPRFRIVTFGQLADKYGGITM